MHYKITQLLSKEITIRCNDCNKSISFAEATDQKWGMEYDGLCYADKKKAMRSKALNIIGD